MNSNSFLYQLRKKAFHYFLSRKLKGLSVDRAMINIKSAKTVGILYNASKPDESVLVTRFAEKLKQQDKKVTLLGYVDDTKTESLYGGVLLFNKKQTNWYLHPRSEAANSFMAERFDILINAFVDECLPLEYIAAMSKATFRVGRFFDDKLDCYELMINTGNQMDLEYLLKQIHHFLNVINEK